MPGRDYEAIMKSKQKEDFYRFSAYLCAPEVLFIGLAEEFKIKPSKKKAIALYEIFCTKASPLTMNLKDKHLAPGNKELVAVIDELKKLKAEADDMHWWDRIATSKDRKPPKDMFEGLVANCEGEDNEDCTGDCAFKFDLGTKFDDQKAIHEYDRKTKKVVLCETGSRWVKATWMPERAKLETAGFELAKKLK